MAALDPDGAAAPADADGAAVPGRRRRCGGAGRRRLAGRGRPRASAAADDGGSHRQPTTTTAAAAAAIRPHRTRRRRRPSSKDTTGSVGRPGADWARAAATAASRWAGGAGSGGVATSRRTSCQTANRAPQSAHSAAWTASLAAASPSMSADRRMSSRCRPEFMARAPMAPTDGPERPGPGRSGTGPFPAAAGAPRRSRRSPGRTCPAAPPGPETALAGAAAPTRCPPGSPPIPVAPPDVSADPAARSGSSRLTAGSRARRRSSSSEQLTAMR